MSATTPFMRLHGARLLDAGFHIIPIAAGKKYPGQYSGGRWEPMPSWSRFSHHKPSDATIDMWANWPGAGVGIVTGGASGVIGVDIDILDEELANKVKLIFFQRLGMTPLIRVGLAPKMMLLYRVGAPMNKISMQPIEVLATGQQFVAYGVHPDTGRDYHWSLESPVETPVEQLPLVTEAQVKAACDEAYAIVPSGMKPKRLTSVGADTPVTISSETAPATIEAITEALQHIPNQDLQWDDWKKILMATFACSRGSEPAYFAFLEWSKKSAKHNDRTTRNEWNSCKASPPRSLNFGTLHYYASLNGWVPSDGLYFNEEKRDAKNVDVSGFDAWPTQPAATPYKTAQQIIAADPARRFNVLKSIGLEPETVVDPETGEITEVMHATRDTGGMSMQEYQGVALNTIVEGTPGNLFFTGEPEKLKLTQDEIENGSMPRAFADDFPHEWLFTSSLIGRIAHWIDSTCLYQHRLYCLMTAFTIFGSIVGRQYRTRSGLRPSTSCIIIGKTGVGKEPMFRAATELMKAADAENRMGPRGGWSSGTGVVNGLFKKPSVWVGIDEFGKKLAAYGSKGDQNQREMVAMYLEAIANDYIGGKGYASEETETRNVTFPNLNIFGGSQMDQLTEALSSSAASDGFIQRFLFVPTFAHYPPMRRDFEPPPVPVQLVNEIKAIISDLQSIGGAMATNDDPVLKPHMRVVEVTAEAKEMIYLLDDRKRDLLSHDRTMWVRSVAHTIKIAMLEAIAVDPINPVITVEGLNNARKLVDWFMRYAETYVVSLVADNDRERTFKKLKSIIVDGGGKGVSRRELSRKMQKLSSRERDDMFKSLIECSDVELRNSPSGKPGRPGEMYHWVAP